MERGDMAVPTCEMAKKPKLDSDVSWADLPPDVVNIIADRLCNLDFFALRQVCSSWSRSVSFPRKKILSLSLPISIPWLFPRWDFGMTKTVTADCVLSTGSVYAIRAPFRFSYFLPQSSKFFILYAEEFAEGRLWLRNPLSGRLVSELPYQMPGKLNLLEFGAVEVAKCYSISTVPRKTEGTPHYNIQNQFLKVVLSSGGISALVLGDTGVLRALNTREQEWKIIHDGKGYKFDDIVEYNEKVFGVDRRGKLYSIEYNGMLWEWTVVGRGIAVGGGRRKRLVVSSGDLYLLASCDDRGLKVFKLKLADRSLHRWVRVTNLGDQIFFVRSGFSFSISTEGLGRNRGSCILFTKEGFPCYNSMGEYYATENDEVHLEAFCFDEGESADLVVAPSYTSTFWPLPFWLHPKLDPLQILEHGINKILSRIQGANQNTYGVGHFKRLLDGVTEFFQAWQRFMDSVIVVKQPLVKGSTNFQDKVEGMSDKIEENRETELSEDKLGDSTRKQSGDIRELYARVERIVLLFQETTLKTMRGSK